MCRDPTILDTLDLTEEERGVLLENIRRRLTPQAVKIRAGRFIVILYYHEGTQWAVRSSLIGCVLGLVFA